MALVFRHFKAYSQRVHVRAQSQWELSFIALEACYACVRPFLRREHRRQLTTLTRSTFGRGKSARSS